MRTLPLLLGLLVGFVVAVLPSCGPPACSAASCPLGCCDASGRCQASSNSTCGVRGAVCASCSLTESCLSGACMTGSSGAGTGGGPTGGGSGTGGGTSSGGYSAFLDNFSAAYCQKAIQCGSLPASSQAECAIVIRTLFATSGSGLGSGYVATERSVRAGAATFNATQGQACLASIANITCVNGQPSGSPTDCTGFTTPVAAAGGACFNSTDCTDTTLSCNGAACARTCTPGGNLGEGCKADRTCNTPFVCISGTCRNEPAPGSQCSGFDSCGPRQECRTGVCVALPAIGAACPNFRCVPGAYCDTSRVCQAQKPLNSGCSSSSECLDGALCPAGTCVPAGAQGATCRFSSDCQRPLLCIYGRCNPQGASGARCLYSSDCQSPLGCDDVLKICRAYTATQQTGQTCSSTQGCQNPVELCRNKSVTTDGGTGTPGACGAPAQGDPCQSLSDCGAAQYCNMTSRTCQPAGAATPCNSTTQCRSTDYCTSSNVCATKAAAGQLCDSSRSDSCAAQGEQCLTTPPNPARCQRTPTLGEACGTECQFPYACSGGTCVAAGRAGQPCIPNSPMPCLVGECLGADGGIGRTGSCVAPRGDGAQCSTDMSCQSGYCDISRLGSSYGVCVPACR